MAFRYRKSINLGGGIRINLSKSGIGYSWGFSGYRVTKTSKGKTRRTISIPGTGLSWVDESKKSNPDNKNVKPSPNQVNGNNLYDTVDINNEISNNMVSDGLEDMLAMAKKILKWNKIANISIISSILLSIILPIFIFLLFIAVILKVFIKTKGIIKLDYVIENDQIQVVEERMKPLLNILKSNKVWRIMQSSKVVDKKYTSGASNLIKRTLAKANSTAPFPFKTNTQVASIKANNEILLFLPDKLFIIKGTNIGVLNYSDFTCKLETTSFVENEPVPKDATITGQTWEYVNKTGEPDKRFKNNRKLPICKYGKLELESSKGLNSVIMFSNINFLL